MSLRTAAALILILSAASCTDNTETAADYGSPPEPEKCFLSPEGVERYLEWTAANYPEIASLRLIGESESGRGIYALELSDKPGTPEAEPPVLIAGGIHGHEQASVGVSLKLIEYLLENYSSAGSRAEKIITDIKLHIIPVINPDGLAGAVRYNSNGVDLNRNFGYNWYSEESANGDAPFDQAESRALRDDFLENTYTLALILHTSNMTSGIGIYAPWDAIPTDTPDFTENYLPNYPFIQSLGSAYSDAVAGTAGYPYSSFFRYQEGADWYVVYGSINDWALGTTGSVCYSVELYGKQNFSTDDSELLTSIWEAHRSAMTEIISASEFGTGGRLLAADGAPAGSAGIILSTAASASKSFSPQPLPELKGLTGKGGYFRILTGAGFYQISFAEDDSVLSAEISCDTDGFTSINGGAEEFYPEYQFQ